jgi:hypothetical protein
MPTSKVNPSNITTLWQKVNSLKDNIPQGRVKFKVRDNERKREVCQGYEQTFSTEIFRVFKVSHRLPQPVYVLSELQDPLIESQFYNYELVKVTVSPQTEFQIDKIVRHGTRTALNNILSSGEDTTRPSTVG